MSRSIVHLETQSEAGRRIGRQAALSTAIVAGAFVLGVMAIMLASVAREKFNHPLTLTRITEMRQQLLKNPDNEALRSALRQEDRAIRSVFFFRRAFINRGAYLLLGGGVALLACLKLAAHFGKGPHFPDPQTPSAELPRTASLARVAVGVSGLMLAGALLALAAMPRYQLPRFVIDAPRPGEKVEPSTPLPEVEPTPEMFARNWNGFRGPTGSGIAAPGSYPTQWDAETKQNVLWKSAVPMEGNNSPVVWEGMVFLTGASKDRREVYCFDASTGSLKWKQALDATPGAAEPEISEQTSLAPSTVATDGKRVYAIFPTADLAAFDFGGKKLWQRNLGLPENTYGHASSLLAVNGRVIVQYDQGHNPKDEKSALLAFDGATGKPAWAVKRPVEVSWTTPILANTAAGPQIIAAGNPLVIAHDPSTGAEIWRAKLLQGEVAPSPVFAGGMVYVANDRADLAAIKPDGKGDVTSTHVPWKYPDDLPDITSPLATGDLVFMVTTSGTLSCIDAKTGQKLWGQDLETDVNASPVLAGKMVYLTDLKGVTYLFEPGREYKPLGKAALGEPVHASPAFVDGRIYFRTKQHLYCIGVKP